MKARSALAGRRAGLLVVAAFVVVTLLVQLALRGTQLRGDEYTYVAGARALGAVLAGRATLADALPVVIGPGWFMPGLSIALAPLFALVDQPAQWMIHAWMGLFNGSLLLALGMALRRHGARAGLPLIVLFPGLTAAGQVAMVTALPDFAAGCFLALALLTALAIGTRLAAGQGARWRQILLLEGLLAAALYARGPMILPALAIHCVLLAVAMVRGRMHLPSMARIGCGMAALALMLAPWSFAVSRHFGETVITTTNVPLVLANSFGDPDKTCFGPCAAGHDIWPAWHFAQDRARQTGESPLAVQRAMMANALQGLTVAGYLGQVKDHFGRFLLDPAGRVQMTLAATPRVPPHMRNALAGIVWLATWAVYLPFMLALFAANVGWFRRSDSHVLQSLLIKAATLCLFTQPFLHKSSSRYWLTFAPLAAWSASMIWQIRADKRLVSQSAQARLLPAVFDWLQMAYAALFLFAAIVIAAQ